MATTTMRARAAGRETDTGELLDTHDTTQALRLALGIVLVAGLLGAAAIVFSAPGDTGQAYAVAQAGD